ncbi:MAG: alanine racemase [Gemmatimonadota bacterium]
MSTNPKARAWLEVRADALLANYDRVRASVGPGVRILPMVKANAYGLGAEQVVACLEDRDPWGYGVAAVSEGVALRDAGVTRPIVVCSPVPPSDADQVAEASLQPFVGSVRGLERLSDAAARRGVTIDWHLDVDTGMGRSGFPAELTDAWLDDVTRERPGLRLVGVDTHLHSADENADSIHAQWALLAEVVDRIGLPEDGAVHILNSAGALRTPEYARSMVRPGIFLYGGGIGDDLPRPDPVVSMKAAVGHVRDAKPGTTLGYGSTYAATSEERWATLTIGYGDGLPRALSNRGEALVEGARVPIIGRISMDVTVVNITGVSGVDVGSVATLIGRDGQDVVSVDQVAAWADTISYEVLTGLTGRLPRVWT